MATLTRTPSKTWKAVVRKRGWPVTIKTFPAPSATSRQTGLIHNPVQKIRKPAPGQGRNRRLGPVEERTLLAACDAYSNPMLAWIVRPALHTGIRAGEIMTLRHEAVSRLVELGLGDQKVAAISGHKSMQMLRRYTHLRAEDLVARLDELKGRPGNPSDARNES